MCSLLETVFRLLHSAATLIFDTFKLMFGYTTLMSCKNSKTEHVLSVVPISAQWVYNGSRTDAFLKQINAEIRHCTHVPGAVLHTCNFNGYSYARKSCNVQLSAYRIHCMCQVFFFFLDSASYILSQMQTLHTTYYYSGHHSHNTCSFNA